MKTFLSWKLISLMGKGSISYGTLVGVIYRQKYFGKGLEDLWMMTLWVRLLYYVLELTWTCEEKR